AKTSYIRAYGIAEYATIPIIGVVEFLEGTWVINNRVNDMIPLWSETNEIEILGNIHDNPELLEV
ncbi:TPA: YopX family protein, partial [Listeria innocua]